MTNVGDFAGSEIAVEVDEVHLEIRKRLTLGKIIRKLVQITEPVRSILPVGIRECFHYRYLVTVARFGKGDFYPRDLQMNSSCSKTSDRSSGEHSTLEECVPTTV